MREAIATSPVVARRSSLRSRIRSSPARWVFELTPSGLERYSTGSPALRKVTPWYVDGKNPLDQFEAPPLVPLPELSTTKAGRFRDSLPKPYVTHAPIEGRPN